ncbi:MAG: flagellar basal body L-ring protein FlgH [Syntrophobacteraceae bacterium]
MSPPAMGLKLLRGLFGLAAAVSLLLFVSGCGALGAKKASEPGFAPPAIMSSPQPIPAAGAPPVSLDPTGSLWNSGGGSLYADLKAHKVGDLVTITVSENSSGTDTGATTTSKASTSQGSIAFSGLGIGASGVANPSGAFSFGPYNTSFTRTFKGSGSTSQTNTVTAYMTATVIGVLPNGNLVIRGTRWTKVNDQLQQIVLEGVIRPVDISDSNTILSQDVAEAKIFMLGKGPVNQYQKPGWLEQIWNVISPF